MVPHGDCKGVLLCFYGYCVGDFVMIIVMVFECTGDKLVYYAWLFDDVGGSVYLWFCLIICQIPYLWIWCGTCVIICCFLRGETRV